MSMRKTMWLAGAAALVLAVPAWAQEVTIVLPEEPAEMDLCDSGISASGRVLWDNIGEALTTINPENGEVEPMLATEWKRVDDDTWSFTIRGGVTFHNGEKLDAATVAHTVERLNVEKLECFTGQYDFANIKLSAVATGPMTVELTTSEPDPILPTRVSFMPIDPPSASLDAVTKEPVGTGPYRFVAWKPGESIRLERYDGYWGDKPAAAAANFLWRSDPAVRAAMVATGEADLGYQISPQDATTDQDVSYPNSETSFLLIDVGLPPLTDKRVRQALNHAIDRQAMVGTIFHQDAVPASQMVVPGTLGYNDRIAVPAYDPELARKLIAEAKADGVPTETEIVILGRIGVYPNSAESMEAVQAMLQDVGFNVRLQMMEVAAYGEYWVKPYPENRPANVIQSQHDNSRGDAVFTAWPKYGSGGSQSRLSDPTLDDLINRATAASGPERRELWEEMFRVVHEDIVAEIPLFHMVETMRIGSRVNYTPSVATTSRMSVATVTFK